MASVSHAAWWSLVLLCISACDDPPPPGDPASTEVQSENTQRHPPEYWAARLTSASAATRREALAQLGTYGVEASEYGPIIIPLLRDPDEKTGFTAAWALAHLGMGAHPLLIDRLESNSPIERERAAYGVGEIGPAAAAAAERLQDLAQDPNPRVRNMADWALNQVASRRMVSDPNMALLTGARGNKEERLAAVERLGAIAYRSRVAVRELIILMGDSIPAVRGRAILALSKTGLPALPALSVALSNRRKEIRRGAVLAISGMKRAF